MEAPHARSQWMPGRFAAQIGSWGLAASKNERNTTHLPVPPHPPAATGKKKGRKTAGGGGVLGKLGLKKGAAEGAEEEPAGAGTAGSPRYIQVRWCRGGLRQHACVDTEHGNRAVRAMTETCNLHHSFSCPCQAASPPLLFSHPTRCRTQPPAGPLATLAAAMPPALRLAPSFLAPSPATALPMLAAAPASRRRWWVLFQSAPRLRRSSEQRHVLSRASNPSCGSCVTARHVWQQAAQTAGPAQPPLLLTSFPARKPHKASMLIVAMQCTE